MGNELSASVVSWTNFDCVININGTRYVYQSDCYPGYVLKSKFESISRYSKGKAVQWIKNNVKMVDKY